jgi:hypothetical protein
MCSVGASRLRTPEIALRSYPAAAAASRTRCRRLPAWHAPPPLIRPARITRHELAARNRCARFQAIRVGVLRRSAPTEHIGNAVAKDRRIGRLVIYCATPITISTA